MKVEFYILENIVDCMEENGVISAHVTLSVNPTLVEEINKKHKTNLSLSELEKAADICLAREWLKYAYMGTKKYESLKISATGVGIVRSRRNAEEKKKSRTPLKKVSDFIEEHKGIITFITAMVAIVGLYLNYLRIK